MPIPMQSAARPQKVDRSALARKIENAMQRAAQEAMAEGITDQDETRSLMLAARDEVLAREG